MVAGLIQSENVAAVAHKNSDKQADDSGLESGHTSMNNCKLHIYTDLHIVTDRLTNIYRHSYRHTYILLTDLCLFK